MSTYKCKTPEPDAPDDIAPSLYGAYVSFMSTTGDPTDAEIWARVIQPDTGDMSEESAREFLKYKLKETDRARVQELSAKAHEGTLTRAEDRELECYLRIGRTLEILKAKARISLNKRTA